MLELAGDGERPAMLSDLRQVLDEAMEAHRGQLALLLDELRAEIKTHRSEQAAAPQELVAQKDVRAASASEIGDSVATTPLPLKRLSEGKPPAIGTSDADLAGSASPATQEDAILSPSVRTRSIDLKAENNGGPRTSEQHISRKALLKSAINGTCLQRFVQGAVFENMSGALICINAVIIGMHANERALDPATCKVFWSHVFLTFNLIFLLELILRVGAFGKMFFCGADWRWNLFDVLIVFAGLFEDIMGFALRDYGCGVDDAASSNSLASSITVVRILRIARVVRMVKAFRTMTIFQDLRLMVSVTINCIMPLLWASILLLFIHWCFGVYFLHLATDFATRALARDGPSALERDDVKAVRHWFGSLWGSMYTLFMSITGGTSWEGACGSLADTGEYHSMLFFIFFVALTMFAVLNVITGVFVENATSWAMKDREMVIANTLQNKEHFVRDLKAVFHEADEDSSGQLTFAEIEEHIEDPRVQAFLEFLQLESVNSHKMIALFDMDGSGTISLEEFVVGCMEMKGDAKALDIAELKMDIKRLFAGLSMSIGRLERNPANVSILESPDFTI